MRNLLLIVLALAFITTSAYAQPAAALLAGFGETDITPDPAKKPVYLAGFGKNRKATKVHD